MVLYWYWAHDRGVAGEYWAKVYLVADAMRMNRSDGSLVRIMTEMLPGKTLKLPSGVWLPLPAESFPCLMTISPVDSLLPIHHAAAGYTDQNSPGARVHTSASVTA